MTRGPRRSVRLLILLSLLAGMLALGVVLHGTVSAADRTNASTPAAARTPSPTATRIPSPTLSSSQPNPVGHPALKPPATSGTTGQPNPVGLPAGATPAPVPTVPLTGGGGTARGNMLPTSGGAANNTSNPLLPLLLIGLVLIGLSRAIRSYLHR